VRLHRQHRLNAYRSVQRRYRPGRRQFERLVLEALASLPNEFRQRLDNVALVVEDWPSTSEATGADGGETHSLLGLYRGTPLGNRGTDYHLSPPDRITIYRRPILALCRTRAEVIREVRDTVVHEVGHYFGLGEDELG
jgi:predicted Zn-dependent protease with MMP-like domain